MSTEILFDQLKARSKDCRLLKEQDYTKRVSEETNGFQAAGGVVGISGIYCGQGFPWRKEDISGWGRN